MSKRTRFKYSVAQQRGTTKTIAESTTLTADNILKDGNSFIKINGAFILTLPAAETKLKGASLLVFGNNASSQVFVLAGFGGGGGSYDTVTVGAYNTVEFWCDGSSWYALSGSVAAS